MSRATGGRPARAWQRMLSGRRLNLLEPTPFDVEIEDIAHGLSRVARWNGQTSGEQPFSVAEHSLLVEQLVVEIRPATPPRWQLAALLHDAPEYVIGDLISPFKAAVGQDYREFEGRLQAAIHIRFGLPAVLPRTVAGLIKRADTIAAYIEATQLAGFDTAEAGRIFGRSKFGAGIRITPGSPEQAKRRFLDRFAALQT